MTDKLTFEQAYEKLEAVVAEIEDENTPLERLLSLYEEGNELSTYCQEILKKTEDKLKVLKQDPMPEEV